MKLMGQIFLTFGTEVKTLQKSHGHMVIAMLWCVCVCLRTAGMIETAGLS